MAEQFDVPSAFGAVRVYRFEGPTAGAPVVPEASRAINGEYPQRIADAAHRFWDAVDAGG